MASFALNRCVSKSIGLYMVVLGVALTFQWHPEGQTNIAVSCPCANASLCKMIEAVPKTEVFVFSVRNDPTHWAQYDWTRITTVVMFGYKNPSMMCLAHYHGARVVYLGRFPGDQLTNSTARAMWVTEQLDIIKDNFLDGINFDFEGVILKNQTDLRDGFTSLVTHTYETLKTFSPTIQISVDVAWSPNCIDLRCYDYLGLSKVSDLFFIMAYSEQSRIFGECIAKSNSDYMMTKAGISDFFKEGIPPSKLVLGISWGGQNYPCLSIDKNNVCYLKHEPWRGANCSDIVAHGTNEYTIQKLLSISTSGRLWNKASRTPFFNYLNRTLDELHQVQYDDPESITIKYKMGQNFNLLGLGVWHVDALNYTDMSQKAIVYRKQFWETLRRH